MSPLTSAPFLVDTYVSTDMLFLHYICFRLLESGETTSKFYDLSTAKKRTYSLLEEGSSMPKAPEDIVVAEKNGQNAVLPSFYFYPSSIVDDER